MSLFPGAFHRYRVVHHVIQSATVAVLLGLMWPSVGAAAQIVVPNSLTSVPGNSQFGNPLGCVPPRSERYQQVYRGVEVGSGTITAIAFRREETLIFPDGSPITIPNVTITLSSTTAGPDTLSTTFASNVGADVVTVFSGDVTSFTNVTGPGLKPFDTIIPLTAAFTFDATTGKNLLLDITVPSCPVNALISFDVASVANDSVSIVRASDAGSSAGFAATSGLVTQFTLTAAAAPSPTSLVAAVLPNSRAVQVGTPATVSATVINAGGAPASQVGIALASAVPASFGYWLLDTSVAPPQLIGLPNTPVNIPACVPPAPCPQKDFLLFMTPTSAFGPTELSLTFAGINTPQVTTLVGINTLLLLASATPTPDMVALAATAPNDGIARISGVMGTGFFVVATTNLGVGDTITVSADTGAAAVPVDVLICQTDPGTGGCLSTPTPTATMFVAAGAQPTFASFVRALGGAVPLDPAANRVFARFRRSDGLIAGGTSVAVMTE